MHDESGFWIVDQPGSLPLLASEYSIKGPWTGVVVKSRSKPSH